MSNKLTLKKAEGYIKSCKVIITLEYRYDSCYRWWIDFSSFEKDTKFCSTYFFANRYFNKLVKKWGLDVTWNHDKEDE